MHVEPESKGMIKVMIVDDSAVVRSTLTEILERCPDIQVIGVASDPIFAQRKMEEAWPDVLILDVEMPRMDGITFLRQLMAQRPTATVICSTLTTRGSDTTFRAFEAGAVSVISKPTVSLSGFLHENNEEIVHTVRAAAAAKLKPAPTLTPPPKPAVSSPARGPATLGISTRQVVAIGISTGGPQALEYLLTTLPPEVPGMVIVQHMPAQFTSNFASRLDQLSQLEIKEAATGDVVLPGRALIAPGGRHLQLKQDGGHYVAQVLDGPLVSHHRPSADVLFRSVARIAGDNALGIIMTGMGSDGARGLKEMHAAGAWTVAQDEESSIVFGMPREAIRLGAVRQVVALQEIPDLIKRYSRSGK